MESKAIQTKPIWPSLTIDLPFPFISKAKSRKKKQTKKNRKCDRVWKLKKAKGITEFGPAADWQPRIDPSTSGWNPFFDTLQ